MVDNINEPGEWQGRIVIVTGGTRGIGLQTARLFADLGARVLACGNDLTEIEAVRSQGLQGIEVSHLDVGREESISSWFNTNRLVVAEGLDVLVNCAGIQCMGSASDTDLATWNHVMQINVTGAFLTSKYALPGLRKRGGGAIVNVSSIHARVTAGSRVAYVASKTALLGLTKAMAMDHAHENVRVNVVLPGTVETPMLVDAWAKLRPDRPEAEMRAHVANSNPVGRIGQPEDVANAIAFLCSKQALFITGVELLVDGGLSQKLAIQAFTG